MSCEVRKCWKTGLCCLFVGKNNGFLGYISRSAARRARRATSKALRAFTTPLLPDDYVGLLNPLRGRELRGRIESVEHHSNFTTINIMSGPGLKPDFRPGQFIGVGLRLDGVWRWRCYSLTNPPATEAGASIAASSSDANRLRRFTISIKPVPGGLFSGHLADNAESGQLIRLSAPGGDFYLPEPLPPRIVFVTAGAGITPVMSMLRWLRQTVLAEQWPQVTHIHSERAPEPSAPYGEELTALAAGHPKYRLVHWDSSANTRLTMEDIDHLATRETTSAEEPAGVPAKKQAVFACGPGEMLAQITETFPDATVEHFHTPHAATENAGGVIEFAGTDVVTESNGTTTILEAGEAADLQLVHGCRMGICRTCVSPIEEGNALDLRDGTTYGEGEQIRTCCTVPVERVRVGVLK